MHESDLHELTPLERLAGKSRSLDILYDIASSLGQARSIEELLDNFLDTFVVLVGARAASVCLLDDDGHSRLAAGRGPGERLALDCLLRGPESCTCHQHWSGDILRIRQGNHSCPARLGRPILPGLCEELVRVPVRYRNRTLGYFHLHLDRPLVSLGEDVQGMLTSIGMHLGLAIEKLRLDTDARRLAIMEERNTIGNELHDSLAQVLVGLRLQAKMLGEHLHRKDLRAASSETRRLRDAIEVAHGSLRELLANFRLKMDERGLVPAIEGLVERFNAEPGISAFFHNECRRLDLTPAQEIQVFYIVQETLANIRRHSQATHARIRLADAPEGGYSLLVEDDGLGIALAPEGTEVAQASVPGEHIGLAVMRERAKRLAAELVIESEAGEGTRISLTFGRSRR